MRDIVNNLKVVASLAPASHTANADGAYVDTRGFGSVMLAGARSVDNAEFTILESDTNSGGTVVDAADLDLVIDAAGVQSIGYKGSKRYVAARVIHGSPTASAVVASAVFVLGHPRQVPVDND